MIAAAYAAEDYHQQSDEWSPDWDLSGLVRDAQLVYAVAERLGNSDDWPNWAEGSEFKALRARFVPDAHPDPHDVLGVEPGTDLDTIRQAWRALVRDTHPDRMIARGVPEEAVKMAEKRLIAINRAWEELSEGHA